MACIQKELEDALSSRISIKEDIRKQNPKGRRPEPRPRCGTRRREREFPPREEEEEGKVLEMERNQIVLVYTRWPILMTMRVYIDWSSLG
jgi:hypothetical protein